MARFLSWTGSGFNLLSAVPLRPTIESEDTSHALATTDGTWTQITGIAEVPEGATHWWLDLSVSLSDPTLPDVMPPPPDHVVLYIDGVFVPDNGLSVATEPYLEGDQDGMIWEGVPHNSPSIYGEEYVDPGDDVPLPDDGEEGGVEGGDTDAGEHEPLVSPGYIAEAPAFVPVRARPIDVAQERISAAVPGGLCLDEDIQLGELVLNCVDEFGTLWVTTDVEGWWTLPEPDIPDFPRGLDDGSYDSIGRYTARIFTLSGSFWPGTSSQVRAARDRLIRAANLCHYGTWFATHESDATRASRVWLSGQPSIATVSSNGRTDFSIGLKAPDPIKYGLRGRALPGWYSVKLRSRARGGSNAPGRPYDRTYPWMYPPGDDGVPIGNMASPDNVGNVRVYPIITLTGPSRGAIQVMNLTTEQTMRVNRRLRPGEELVIDCMEKTVSLNGATNQRFYLDLDTEWIYLNPGSNTFFFVEEHTVSSARMTISWRPGWIG